MMNKINKGIVTLEVIVPSPEKFLNLLWKEDINIAHIKRESITTIILSIDYRDYDTLVAITNKCRGKVILIKEKGGIFFFKGLLKKKSLLVGGVIFIGILFYLSTYIWAIEIKTEKNVSPYEIRRDLKYLGIKPGMSKSQIDVYDLESKLDGINDNIMWLRIRIEGSTLKVTIEEKVNPPRLQGVTIGDSIAKIGGEVKRIYVTSGRALVTPGDIVKEGDVLIEGIQGKEENQYEVPAKGVVVANTFYERAIEMQISGTSLERTGDLQEDIYISIFGKKVYLKKAISTFEYYDKIIDNNTIFSTIKYYEKKEKEIQVEREAAIEEGTLKLEESLRKNLTNNAKIIDKNLSVENIEGGKIRVKVVFVVEQDISLEVTE